MSGENGRKRQKTAEHSRTQQTGKTHVPALEHTGKTHVPTLEHTRKTHVPTLEHTRKTHVPTLEHTGKTHVPTLEKRTPCSSGHITSIQPHKSFPLRSKPVQKYTVCYGTV